MTQGELFALLLVTICMGIGGMREFTYGRHSMAAMLILIPLAGWLSIFFGKITP
jgi:hypothetical protein